MVLGKAWRTWDEKNGNVLVWSLSLLGARSFGGLRSELEIGRLACASICLDSLSKRGRGVSESDLSQRANDEIRRWMARVTNWAGCR